jgi:hypothetical protein
MPGLWKAWKAKSRLPTLSTSPLGISPTAGEIPTFPQRRRRRRWKSGKPKAGFPLSHRPEDILGKPTKSQGGRASPCARQTLSTTTKGDLSRQPGRRHFQAHAALESNCRFRLMAYWNQFSISGSFVDWNMLCGPQTTGKTGGQGTPLGGALWAQRYSSSSSSPALAALAAAMILSDCNCGTKS